MNKKQKKLMHKATRNVFYANRLMQSLHECYGIDFEAPFVFEQFVGKLTKNTFKAKYPNAKQAFLLFVEYDRPNRDDLHICPWVNGEFYPKKGRFSHSCDPFFSVGDFEEARKGVEKGKIADRRGYSRLVMCYVLIPTVQRYLLEEQEQGDKVATKVDDLIKKRLVRITEHAGYYVSSSNMRYRASKVGGWNRGFDFRYSVQPDKSGYLPRTEDFQKAASFVRSMRSKKTANDMDWSEKMRGARCLLEMLKQKTFEKLQGFDCKENIDDLVCYAYYRQLDNMIGYYSDALRKTNRLQNCIDKGILMSVEQTERAFQDIADIVKIALEDKEVIKIEKE